MGYITVRTTTVSEFVASMKKLHLPEQIIIYKPLPQAGAFGEEVIVNSEY